MITVATALDKYNNNLEVFANVEEARNIVFEWASEELKQIIPAEQMPREDWLEEIAEEANEIVIQAENDSELCRYEIREWVLS